MQNLYEPPKTTPSAIVKPEKSAFSRANKVLKFSSRYSTLITVASFTLGIIAQIYDLDLAAQIFFVISIVGVALVAISILAILPLTIWGFITGLKDSKSSRQKSSDTINQP